MRILLTNDDGIHAPGINAMRKVLEEIGEVIVVAPDRERSATGHCITVHAPLRAEEHCFADGSAKGYAIDGTPSDCIKLAMDALLTEAPDLVVSGINRGPNLGTDVLYSGTVSAAIEGLIYGIPSIAVSCYENNDPDYELAAKYALVVIKEFMQRSIPKNTLLNINIPTHDVPAKMEYKITKLGHRRYENIFDKRLDPRGKAYYWLAGEVLEVDTDPESDVAAVNQKSVSITPIHFDLTDYGIMNQIRDWKLKYE